MRPLEGQTPWLPDYVPMSERPRWWQGGRPHVVQPGHVAFWMDPEIGATGVTVAWVAGDRAGVQFSVARDETPEQRRRGERNVHVVPVSELRDTYELAQLASWGRNIVARAA